MFFWGIMKFQLVYIPQRTNTVPMGWGGEQMLSTKEYPGSMIVFLQDIQGWYLSYALGVY